ncbi:tape measure protein [Alkalihalobacillus trypoxylicola]|uniref:Tape measure protein N-terminal domain-containing protein n=1 Tax=Alkalihalobacillus trypoxylicola TaxID=519424 RepID=A0A162D5I1_9BACI|nr:tape measure protein [Alkalihalobacillus trypoxylicola]KYG28182.1 hypothetical protein AZF04_09780 [Alkalihalobacillus trypoxylicola]
MADGKIIIDVMLEDGQVAKGVANLDRDLGGLEKSGERGSLGIGKIVTALGLVAIGAKAIGLVRDSIDSAFKRIDTMEAFDRTMTAITGSSEAASKALDRTSDAVTGTAYGLDVAAAAVQNFVTRGTDINKATDYIATWGDAVAFYGDGTNDQLSSVSDALAKMLTTNKVTMDQVNRLYDAGIAGPEMYADATGKSVEKVQKEFQSGKITAEDFVDVVTEAMKEGTDSFVAIEGAAKESGNSWGNVFGNMRAAVTRGVISIIQSIDEMLTSNGLPEMRSMIAQFGKTFENILKKAAEAIPPFIQKIIDVYNFMKPILPLLGYIALAIGMAVAAFATFNSAVWIINLVRNAFTLLNNTLLANPIFKVIAVISALVAILIYLYNNNEFVREKIDAAWQAIQVYFAVAMEFIQNIIGTVMPYIMEFIGNILDGIQEFWANNGEMIMSYVELAWEFIKTVISTIGDVISAIVETVTQFIAEVWEKHGETIMSALKMAWDFIKTVVETTINIVWGIIKAILNNIQSYWEAGWQVISAVASVVWEVIKTTINNFIDLIMGIISTVMALIQGDWEGAWESIKQTVENIWNNIKSFFENVDLVKTGKDIISGLIKGIGSMGDAVWESVKGIGSSIKNGFTSFFSIHSPSRWMRDEIGVNLIKGVAVGFDKEENSMKRKTKEATDWMKPDVSEFVNPLRGATVQLSNLTGIGNMQATEAVRQTRNEPYNDAEVKALLKDIAENIGGDLYIGEEKFGSYVDRSQGQLTGFKARRLATGE